MKTKLLILFLLLPLAVFAQPRGGGSTIRRGGVSNIEEVDGSPSVFPYKIKFDNGSLTDNADGTVTHSIAGGTPGGADTQVQFNDSGAFGGDAGLVYDKANDKLTIDGADSVRLILKGNASQTADIFQVVDSSDTVGFKIEEDFNVVIGKSASNKDYSITFDGETNDGKIEWDEDNDWFETGTDEGFWIKGKAAIGILSPTSAKKLRIFFNGVLANNSQGLNVTLQTQGTSGEVVALFFQNENVAGGRQTLFGVNGIVVNSSTGGTTPAMYGGFMSVRQKSAQTITEGNCIFARNDLRSSGDVTDLRGLYVGYFDSNYTGTVTRAKGIYVEEPDVGGGILTTGWSIQSDGDVQINSDKWLILEGSATSKGDSYFTYNSGTTDIDLFVDGIKIVNFDNDGVVIGGTTPDSLFEVDGAIGLAIETVTGNTTLDKTHSTVLVNASGNVVITLPTVASSFNNTDSIGRIYTIKKIDADTDTVTIDGDSAEEIDGETTQVLITQFQSLTIQSNGSFWSIL